VPPNQTSPLGFCASALSCASASPEPFWVIDTLTPVAFWNSLAISVHHSIWSEQ
jgi:hypothetical protein